MRVRVPMDGRPGNAGRMSDEDGAGRPAGAATEAPDTRARERAVRRTWEAGRPFPGTATSPALEHWVSRGCWPPDRTLPGTAVRWVPRLAVPRVAHGLPPFDAATVGVMLYGFAAPRAAGRICALRGVPLSSDGTKVANGFRPPDASPQARWSLAETRGLGVGVRAGGSGAALVTESVASALALSLIYPEVEAGAVFAAGSTEGLGALVSQFARGRPVFVFPDEPSPIRLEAIHHACREAGHPDPRIRMMPGGKNPADALFEAVHRQSGGVLADRRALAAGFRRVLARTTPPLE